MAGGSEAHGRYAEASQKGEGVRDQGEGSNAAVPRPSQPGLLCLSGPSSPFCGRLSRH